MKPRIRWILAGLTLLVGSVGYRRLQACGPSWAEALFLDPGIPDVPRESIAQGEWGVLRPGLPYEDLIPIYRQLQNLDSPGKTVKPGVTAENVNASSPSWERQRSAVLGDRPRPNVPDAYETAEFVTVTRVCGPAFEQAASTLAGLVKEHGVTDPAVKDWALAQDLVFASTKDAPRYPEPVRAPAWLVPQRRYQIAAAHFYASDWATARRHFLEIAKDPSSPWRPWGRYLAARCWVRQAELEGTMDHPGDSLKAYVQAQALLEDLLKDPTCRPLHARAEAYRELTRYRTEPSALLGELLRDLERPNPGGSLDDSLRRIHDCLRFMKKQARPNEPVAAPDSDLARWLGAMAGNVPWKLETGDALARWKAKPGLPWLVAALASTTRDDQALAPLKAAAEKLPSASPLAPSVRWHLLRLKLSSLSGPSLVAQVEAGLKRKDLPPWAVNLLRTQRQALAEDLPTWVAFASRKITATENDYEGPDRQLPTEGEGGESFEPATALTFSGGMPLERVPDLLRDGRVPAESRRRIAQAAWMKAVLLNRWGEARRLADSLPKELQSKVSRLAGQDPVSLRFLAALAVMDWPGMRPVVDGGLRRQYAQVDESKAVDPDQLFDAMRDNWWCEGLGQGRPSGAAAVAEPLPAPFLTAEDQAKAHAEWRALLKVPAAQVWFGEAVIAYAEATPKDPRIPEALHRVVAATRSPLCPSKGVSETSRRAFQLLHKRFPKDPWTKKTPYHY